MAYASDKIMFEIYREEGYARRFRVIFFTELGESNKESEISRAMAGEHFYDGFIADSSAAQGKQIISGVLDRLNAGDSVNPDELDTLLAPFVPAE